MIRICPVSAFLCSGARRATNMRAQETIEVIEEAAEVVLAAIAHLEEMDLQEVVTRHALTVRSLVTSPEIAERDADLAADHSSKSTNPWC